jgi:hypothetical protein
MLVTKIGNTVTVCPSTRPSSIKDAYRSQIESAFRIVKSKDQEMASQPVPVLCFTHVMPEKKPPDHSTFLYTLEDEVEFHRVSDNEYRSMFTQALKHKRVDPKNHFVIAFDEPQELVMFLGHYDDYST